MTRWTNSPQKKDQEETTARDLLKTDISNASEQELRTTAIRILAGFESIEDTRETLTAKIKDLKTSQAEIKNVINEIQNQLDIITTRIEEAEERTGNIEDKIVENKEAERRERKLLDHEYRLRELSSSTVQ